MLIEVDTSKAFCWSRRRDYYGQNGHTDSPVWPACWDDQTPFKMFESDDLGEDPQDVRFMPDRKARKKFKRQRKAIEARRYRNHKNRRPRHHWLEDGTTIRRAVSVH